MPQINSIQEVLDDILTRIGLVNIKANTNAAMIRSAAGSAGSIDARLGMSLKADGSLKTSAIDSGLHGIGHHTDGEGPDGVEYVRMTASERAKLGFVEREANRLVLSVDDQFPTIGNTVTILSGTVKLERSPSIFFDFEAPNIVRAHSAFPPDVAHRHHYGLTPVLKSDSSSSSSLYYATTSISTPFAEGTLRVYVNGVRLSGSSVPVPNSSGSSFLPTYIASESSSDGTFVLNRSLAGSDNIRIDFDEMFVPPSSSSSSSSSSPDCSMYIDCNPSGGTVISDCGLLPVPGHTQSFDCGICECVTTPISSSSS